MLFFAGDRTDAFSTGGRHLRPLRTPAVRTAPGTRRPRERSRSDSGRRRDAGAARRTRVSGVREAPGGPARTVAPAHEARTRLVPPHVAAEPAARPAHASLA